MDRLRSVFGNRVFAFVVGGTLIGVAIFAVAIVWRGGRGETIVLQVPPAADPNVIRVYVGGEVVTPGLYTLPRGSRVAEAIDAAGGATAVGDVAGFGMAAVIEDADQIIVPARQVMATPPPVMQFAGSPGTATVGSAPSPQPPPPPTPSAPGLTNINTASAAELEALPEIGEVLAARIIDHRETNGSFQSVDDLELIDGISQRTVDEIRHLITVGP